MGKLFDEVKNNSSNYKDWLKYYSKKGQETRIAEAENAGLNATQFGILFGGKGTIPDRIDTIIENMKEDQAARILDNVLNLPKGDGIKYSNMTYYEDKEFKAFSDSLKKITGYEESRANIQTLRDTVINNAINTTRNGFAPRMMLKNLIGSAGKYDDKVESATIGLVKDYIERRKQILEAKKDIEVACKLMKEHSLPPILIIELIYCHRDKYPFTDVNQLEILLKRSEITLYQLFQDEDVKKFLSKNNRGIKLISLYANVQQQIPPAGPASVAQPQQIPATTPVAPAPVAQQSSTVVTPPPVTNQQTNVLPPIQTQQFPATTPVAPAPVAQQSSTVVTPPPVFNQQANVLPPIIPQHVYAIPGQGYPSDNGNDNQVIKNRRGNVYGAKTLKNLLDDLTKLINKDDINPFFTSFRDKRRALQELKDLLHLYLAKKGYEPSAKKSRALLTDQRLNQKYNEIFNKFKNSPNPNPNPNPNLDQFVDAWLTLNTGKQDKDGNEITNRNLLSKKRCSFFNNKRTETEKDLEDIKNDYSLAC